MALFDNSNIKLDVLKKRAFNYRWAEVPDGVIPLTAPDRIHGTDNLPGQKRSFHRPDVKQSER